MPGHGEEEPTNSNRRLVLAGIGAASIGVLALVAPQASFAQSTQNIRRVGFIATISPVAELAGPEPANPFNRGFLHGLREHGYVAGRNVQLELRSLEGKPERLEPLVAEFVRLKVEVVFIPSPLLVGRAHKAAPHMPIVTLVGPDLLATGQVRSHARPAGNVTGPMPDVEDDVEYKRLELLLELAPRAKRVAYIGTEAEWSRRYVLNVRAAAKRLGLDFIHVDSGYGDFAPAFARVRQERFDALVVERSSRAYGRRQEVGALAAKSGMPSSCSQGELVEHGCLMSYGPDVPDLGRRAGGYVAKILKGAKPGELPVEAPTKHELTINLRTAKALGIAIPQAVLLRATRVIE